MDEIIRKTKGGMKAELKKQQVEFSPVHHFSMLKLQESQGASQQMLAEAMGRDKAQIARIVASLHRQNLILKEPDAEDKRSVKLTVTPLGEKLLNRLNDVQDEILTRMLTGFSPDEISTFRNLISRANQNLG
jgi:DNA-binding MarR family transcriptional regulator